MFMAAGDKNAGGKKARIRVYNTFLRGKPLTILLS
jgi:hypothetical protein